VDILASCLGLAFFALAARRSSCRARALAFENAFRAASAAARALRASLVAFLKSFFAFLSLAFARSEWSSAARALASVDFRSRSAV
jgi:hypothetical protein